MHEMYGCQPAICALAVAKTSRPVKMQWLPGALVAPPGARAQGPVPWHYWARVRRAHAPADRLFTECGHQNCRFAVKVAERTVVGTVVGTSPLHTRHHPSAFLAANTTTKHPGFTFLIEPSSHLKWADLQLTRLYLWQPHHHNQLATVVHGGARTVDPRVRNSYYLESTC